MKMKVFLSLVLSLVFVKGACDLPSVVSADAVLTKAQTLPSCGTVYRNEAGLVYLKVSDSYIKELLPLLKASLPPKTAAKLQAPPTGSGQLGAHISIIYPTELKALIDPLPERGRKECFTVAAVNYVEPDNSDYKGVYFLQVYSGDLNTIRTNYALSPTYQGRDFFITIAVVPDTGDDSDGGS